MTGTSALDRLAASRIAAVVTMDDAVAAGRVAKALASGGIAAVELTLRTPSALDCLRAMREATPQLLVGAGTVLTPEHLESAFAAGAQFAVSPGVNRRVLEAARQTGVPFAPGVATPSDVETALECDCRLLKFFPAVPLGGLSYLRTMAAPYHHLGVRYIPLGGVTPDNLAEYLAEPMVAAVGGSWLAPANVIAAGDWSEIERRARAASALIQ